MTSEFVMWSCDLLVNQRSERLISDGWLTMDENATNENGSQGLMSGVLEEQSHLTRLLPRGEIKSGTASVPFRH